MIFNVYCVGVCVCVFESGKSSDMNSANFSDYLHIEMLISSYFQAKPCWNLGSMESSVILRALGPSTAEGSLQSHTSGSTWINCTVFGRNLDFS